MSKMTLHAAGAGLAAIAATAPFALASPVRADSSDPAAVLRELKAAVAERDTKIEERFAALERGRTDPLADERIAALQKTAIDLQASLDQMHQAQMAARLNGSGGGTQSLAARQYSEAFDTYFRRGDADQLRAMAVQAAMTTSNDPNGGYLVPVEIEREIDRVLGTVSAMRQLARIQPISGGSYKKRVNVGGAGYRWVGETETRGTNPAPQIEQIEFTPGTISSAPEVSNDLLEDSEFNIETWLSEEVQQEFAEGEGAAFINGDGIKKPRGLLDYPKVADANYAWNSLGYLISGGSAGFAATAPWQAFAKVVAALKTGYRPNARWIANRATLGLLESMKDGQDRPIWQESVRVGQPSTLMGYPVTIDDNMPDVGSGAFPLAFGDFQRGYLIVDRRGISVLRNPFAVDYAVRFSTTKRVGGGVQNFEAIKLLKIADS